MPLTEAGKAPREFASHHNNKFPLVAFPPTGDQLLFLKGDFGSTLILADPASGEVRRLFGERDYEYTAVAFSPDGKLLAAASHGGVVRVWAVGRRLLHTLKGHEGAVWSLAFAADGKTLATGGKDGTARLWELTTGQERARLWGHRGSVFAVALAPDGRALATGGLDGRALLWRLAEVVGRSATP